MAAPLKPALDPVWVDGLRKANKLLWLQNPRRDGECGERDGIGWRITAMLLYVVPCLAHCIQSMLKIPDPWQSGR